MGDLVYWVAVIPQRMQWCDSNHTVELLQQSPLKRQMKYYVSFSNEAHPGHPVGEEAVHTQKLYRQVAQKIMKFVRLEGH